MAASDYEATIGLEVHAELLTKTKLFCPCPTTFGAEPNTQTCPVCIGMPGVLPVLNKRAFELTLKTALALNCEIPDEVNFDRKNYNYPDLPKNYQISQNHLNIGAKGHLDLLVNGEKKRVGIWNVHLEEDAGKNIHGEGRDAAYSFVDLNRTGTPLMEIVSAPDLHSPDEVEAYCKTLRNLLLYLQVCDCKMQEGRLRFEPGISVRRKGAKELGKRVEIKNLGSITAAIRAVEYEIERQIAVLEEGGTVPQETRLWDADRNRSERMREKESSHDYRYFPEPDLVWYRVDEEWKGRIREEIPELPTAKRVRFMEEMGLSDYDAGVLADEKALADYFEECLTHHNQPKAVANWLINDVLRAVKEQGISIADYPVRAETLADLVKIVDSGKLSVAQGREVLAEVAATGKSPDAIIREKGLEQVSDEGALEAAIEKVIAANPQAAADFKAGRKQAMGFLIGQIMRETKGKANAKVVGPMLTKRLAQG
ncbi:MAG: Asp-tRNA(Asn)/Glu-tRNA(Gln) amidotransferase subunit GatB [Planctomycetota bacterium]